MFETTTAADFPVSLFGRGLVFLGGDLFVVLPDCSLYFEGSRPGPEWHRHGTTLRRPRTLREGRARCMLAVVGLLARMASTGRSIKQAG